MRVLGRVAGGLAAAGLVMLAGWLLYLVAMQAGPDLAAGLTSPAGLRSLKLSGAAVIIGAPAGAVAALGVWTAPAIIRSIALVAAAILLLLPTPVAAPALAAMVVPAWQLPLTLLALAGPAAGLSLLLATRALNRVPPASLKTAAASGASPLMAFRLAVIPSLFKALLLAAMAGLVLEIAQQIQVVRF